MGIASTNLQEEQFEEQNITRIFLLGLGSRTACIGLRGTRRTEWVPYNKGKRKAKSKARRKAKSKDKGKDRRKGKNEGN